jgi:hypothetical protein
MSLKAARQEARLCREAGEPCLAAFHNTVDIDDITTPTTSATEQVLQTIGAPLEMPSKASRPSRSRSGSPLKYGRLNILGPSPETQVGSDVAMFTESAACRIGAL